MIYHIFNYCVQGVWYRNNAIYSEDQFDRRMSALDWRLPAGIQVYYYADGERFSLVTPMEVTPVSLKESLYFVRLYRRNCSPPKGHKVSIDLPILTSERWLTNDVYRDIYLLGGGYYGDGKSL